MVHVLADLTVRFHICRLILIVLAAVRHSPSAYNINSRDAKVFRDPAFAGRKSYFGYSVALYAGADESLLLVGAPRANSSEIPAVMEPGIVFKCEMKSDTCREWSIDKSGNGRYNAEINEIKNNSWIGATIAVENKTEAMVVVCPLVFFIYRCACVKSMGTSHTNIS